MELLTATSLCKYFKTRGRAGGHDRLLRAVDGIDFSIPVDSVMALVGESGCGKSTVAKLVLRLMEPTAGTVTFKGEDIFAMDRQALTGFRKSVQIIFQDPFASLNPRRTVYETIAEPLKIHKIAAPRNLRDMVVDILGRVGLGPEVLKRYPHEFSGGQRQRVCIARALAVSPELIIADEPLSALDVSIQAQIINLLIGLKQQSGISFLFISHDLRVVNYFSNSVGVMYLGKIVEYSKTGELFEKPFHPYSEILLAAAPKLEAAGEKRVHAAPIKGEVPSPIDIPRGCPFHPRCPKRFDPCDRVIPLLKECRGRLVSCHLWNPF